MSSEETLQGLMEIAKNNLVNSGSLLPILLVDGNERTIVGIPEMSRTPDERQALFYALGRRFAGDNVQRVTAVMDAYMKTEALGIELPLKRSLADDPEAAECIVVASLESDGRSEVLVCPYERKPTLGGLEIQFEPVRALLGTGELYLLEAFFRGARA